MNRLAKLSANYMGERGFSIGVDDVTPSAVVEGFKAGLVKDGCAIADKNIDAFNRGRLELKPGCNALQSLESELTGVLGKVREAAGKMAMEKLPWENAPRIMAECGSKGSTINISQMIACLGQQAVDGKRIQNGFVNRTLPHFKPDSLYPAAKGFVANSFYSGLTATEFFFHTMGGREGLVDTAVKTAQTGYMARRLMKALEDLSMHYDNSVRNSESTVVQFTYGDDGLDPASMEGDDRPIEFPRVLKHILNTEPDEARNMLSPPQLREKIRCALAGKDFQSLLPAGRQFLDEVQEFLEMRAKELESMYEAFELEESEEEEEDEEEVMRDAVYVSARKTVFALCGICPSHFDSFIHRILHKYKRSHVEPAGGHRRSRSSEH